MVLAKLNHTPGTEATCTEAQVCTVCGTELHAKLNHTPGPEATCQTAQTCTVCGEELSPKINHDYGDWTVATAAKCTVKGVEERKCKRTGCNDTQTRDIDPLGHDWGEFVTTKAATCSATGVETSTCKRAGCNETKTNTLAKDSSNHSYSTSLSKKDNSNHGYKCTLCNNAWSGLTSHSWGKWTPYSTSNDNYRTSHYAKCSKCNGTKSASHSLSTKYVTWTGERHWLYDKCSTCGYEYNTGNYESHSTTTTTKYCQSTKKCSKCTYSTSWNNGNHNYTTTYYCRGISTKLCSQCRKCRYCGGTH